MNFPHERMLLKTSSIGLMKLLRIIALFHICILQTYINNFSVCEQTV